MADDLPASLFRNAIDLNRYSNGVSRKLIDSYNRIIIKAVAELKKIEAMPSSKRPKMKAARLRALLAQTRKSLNGWSGESVADLAKELEGVAQIQSDFATAQMKKALPIGARNAVRSVDVTPAFAKSVVNADPLQVGTNLLSQSLTEAVKGSTPSFSLSAKQGAQVLMPGGESITKLFRGIAEKNAEKFGQIVQDGLLTGETTESLARQLIGNLEFGQKAKSAKQVALAGGEATKMANHQVMTLVRTSVNQVSNVASQQVYKANPEVTKKYRYVATLDGKTSPICRSLDGEEFEYGKGPTPAQHMNCRSTTVAVIDYKGLGISEATQAKIAGIGKRAAAGGSVPTGTTYGKWLYDQRKKGTKFGAGAEQVRALGKEKAAYFNRLAAKYGPDQAMKKFMREDGGEITLKKLEQRYGKPSDIQSSRKYGLMPKTPKDQLPPSLRGNTNLKGDELPVMKAGRSRDKLKRTGIAFMDKHAPEIRSGRSILRRSTFQTGQLIKEMSKEGVSPERMAKLEKLFDAASERDSRVKAKMNLAHAKLRKAMLKPVGIGDKELNKLVGEIKFEKLTDKELKWAKEGTKEYLSMFNGRGTADLKGQKTTPMPKELRKLKPSKATQDAWKKKDEAYWDKYGANLNELGKPGITDARRNQLMAEQEKISAVYKKQLGEIQSRTAAWEKAKEGYTENIFTGEFFKSNRAYELQQNFPSKKVIRGTTGRAYNATETDLLTVTKGNKGDLRTALFHEMTHTVEVRNPMLSSYAKEWQVQKAFSTEKIQRLAAVHPKWQKIVRAQQRINGTDALELVNKKPVFDRQAYHEGVGLKIRGALGETQYVDNYMADYMGKFYAGETSTEVWSVAVEEFSDATGAGMRELYSYHPDLYEMIVGLSATPF